MSPRIVLVGPPGAGKTTVGAILAERWDVGFRDTDRDVEAEAGTTVADLFVGHGEQRFRELEAAAVTVALEADGVVTLGGGAVLDETTRARLAGHTVVFLDVELPDAAARIGLNRDRPLLLGNPRAMLRSMLVERRPLYEQVATVTVATDGLTPDAVADAVDAAL